MFWDGFAEGWSYRDPPCLLLPTVQKPLRRSSGPGRTKRQNCESDSKKASLHISWLPWYRLQWDMENGTRQNHPIFIFFSEEIGNPRTLWWKKGPNQQQIAKTDVERGFKNQPPVAAGTQVAVVDSEDKAS